MNSTPIESDMVDCAPGMHLIIRDEEWMVKKVETNSLDKKTLHCVGISSLAKDHDAMFLTDIEDIEQVDPAKVKLAADDSPYFRRSRLYIESQWRQKIPTDTNLHIGNRAAMDTMNFQLEPAQIALRKTRQRVLIADAVGLGKTLEAGILMSELIARGKGKRILVVTVKSMMMQFQKEMWNRFTIPLVRLDSNRIMTLEQLGAIYRIQFPVLQSYEADTWYDCNGRVVFTNNRSLAGVGYSRPEWDEIKNTRSGTFTRTITDDTQPGVQWSASSNTSAPFDRCDRKQDYKTAWKFFSEKYHV
jgi:hypothetical protein